MRHLGLDFLTAHELSVPHFIDLAARHDIRRVNLLVHPFPPLPYYNLLGDTPTRRETVARCRANGVAVEMIEPFAMAADVDPADFRPALETGAYLGATWINLLSRDTDENRLADHFAAMIALASEYGLKVFTEFHRRQYLKTLTGTVEFLQRHHLDEMRIEIDALHFFRLNGQVEEIVRHRDWIARAQICDGPAEMPEEDQNLEAREHRLPVGEGDFPLQQFIDALPDEITLGIEAPHRDYGYLERVERSVAGARRLMRQG